MRHIAGVLTMTALAFAFATGCDEAPDDVGPPAVVAPSVIGGADEPPPADPPEPEAPEAPAEQVAPPTVVCTRHSECRVLPGVCGGPEACNVASVGEVQQRIEARARITTCGVRGIAAADTTPACVEGTCRALLGPVEEHRCAASDDCVVATGLCGPSEVIRQSSRDAFDARIEALRARGVGCGYGPVPVSPRAVCDDGLCVGLSTDG